jgi:hypothetical protein
LCPWAADRLPAGDFLNLTRVPDAELREIANGRGDLLAERAGVILGFYARENRDEWQSKALEAALLIAAGADLTRLTEWIAVGQERAERIR